MQGLQPERSMPDVDLERRGQPVPDGLRQHVARFRETPPQADLEGRA
jgi:hypothetical protein